MRSLHVLNEERQEIYATWQHCVVMHQLYWEQHCHYHSSSSAGAKHQPCIVFGAKKKCVCVNDLPPAKVKCCCLRFIEHGEYKENQYGTSIEAIRSVQAKNKMCVVDVQPEVRVMFNPLSTSMRDHNMSWDTDPAGSSSSLSGVGAASRFRSAHCVESFMHHCWFSSIMSDFWPLFALLPVNPPSPQALKRLRTAEFKPYVIFVKPRVPESRRRRSAATSPGGGEHGRITVSPEFIPGSNSCVPIQLQWRLL